MQGNIDFTGSLTGSIAGGGGGGSNVTITPTLSTGTKIADYTIDSESGSLYAPTPTSLTAELPLSISNNTISIDLSDYATQSDISDFVTDTDLATVLEDYTTYQYTESRYTPLATFNAYTLAAESHFQKTLTAGENITIDPVTNVISASGGAVNYSTTEHDTGELWIDGTSHVYQKTFQYTLSGTTGQIDLSGLNISKAWIKDGFYDIGATCLSLNEFMSGSAYCYTHINQGLNPPYIDCLNGISPDSTINVTIKYIKNV